MKFIVSVLLTALLSFLSGLYMPWWGIALAAFAVAALIGQRPWLSFLSAFLALFLLWGLMAFGMDTANGGILSRMIAELFHIGAYPFLLIPVTALVGGLVGGGAALSASFMIARPRPAVSEETSYPTEQP